MNKECVACGFTIERANDEGFFIGSMSLNYGMTVMLYLIPVMLLIAAVLGSIYTGIATATEAAAVGVPSELSEDEVLVAVAPVEGQTIDPVALIEFLRARMALGAITGEHHRGRWTDVGTPERLARLDAELRAAGVPAAQIHTLMLTEPVGEMA